MAAVTLTLEVTKEAMTLILVETRVEMQAVKTRHFWQHLVSETAT